MRRNNIYNKRHENKEFVFVFVNERNPKSRPLARYPIQEELCVQKDAGKIADTNILLLQSVILNKGRDMPQTLH